MPTPEEIADYAAQQGCTLREARAHLLNTPCAMPHSPASSHNTKALHQTAAAEAGGMSASLAGPGIRPVDAVDDVSTGKTAEGAGLAVPSVSRAGRRAFADRLTPEQILCIRRIALELPLRTDVVSHSLALRLFSERPEAPEWLKEWAAARHSKHHIPRSLMDAIRIAERSVAHAIAPGREHLRHEAYAPGTMRRHLDGTRIEGGQVESWDDASVNFLLWTTLDGQVRAGRFQLLLGVDHGTDYITGFGFVARPQDSYRAEDALGRAMLPTWRAHGCPQRVVLERGVWEAGRMQDALGTLRVQRSTSYHPRTKLVESIFHRLWTRLGHMPAGVGRSRGEDERGNKILAQIRAGRLDARKVCVSLEEATRALTEVCAAHNREPIESRTYGRWVPEQLWAAQAPANLRQIGDQALWSAAPERRKLKVHRGGMVKCEVQTGWGFPVPFAFGAAELWDKVGRDVWCYFDPHLEGCTATIVDIARRQILAPAAVLLTGDAGAATELRRQQTALVRAEHRALAPGGGCISVTTERRDADETTATTLSRPAAAPANTPAPRETAAHAPLTARRQPAAPAPVDDIDLDLAALEAREEAARAAGLLPTY